uniref:D3Mm3e protein n=1 Tax=Callorhinchus milii TaxID=7868 RepID=V9L5B4_CALMI
MYKKEKSIQIKSSASALYNNLSVLPLSDRKLTYFAVLHSSLVNMVSASTDGLNLSHRQLQAREGSLAQDTSVIIQASWCVLPSRILLVLTSQKGIQMYEADGSIMVYWHALHTPDTPAEEAVFARGIAACGRHYICVGISSGSILVFDIPVKGTNISVSEVLDFHRDPVTDIASEPAGSATDAEADVVTADDVGVLCVWRSGEEFKLIHKISAYGVTCSSVKLWKGIIAAGYGSGQIRVYDAETGTVHVEINAHARWVCALDIASDTGKVSAAPCPVIQLSLD